MLQDPAPLVKLLRALEWAQFAASGCFEGSADDLRDGFIHLSTAAQLAGTMARHFADEKGLIAVELVLHDDQALRWEKSRDGQLFPHLYRALQQADIVGIRQLQ